MSLAHPFFTQVRQYELIESAMRTGDIILYNDQRLLSKQAQTALLISQILSWLPCNTTESLFEGDSVDDDEETGAQASDADRREWLHWRCAAVIVLMTDENASAVHDRQMSPFVLVQDSATHAPEMRPLRSFLCDIAVDGVTHFALRQLFTSGDAMPRQMMMHKSGHATTSQLRDALTRNILSFYLQIRQLRLAEAALYHQHSAIEIRNGRLSLLMHEREPRPQTMERASLRKQMSTHDARRNQVALFKASSAYFALYTLFKVGIVRVEPQADVAACALQENGYIKWHLANNYSFSDEMLLKFKVPGVR